MANLVSVNTIVHACSVVFGVSVRDIRSPRRDRQAAAARFAACLLAKELTELSYPQIGHALGTRDHTTVMRSVREAEARCNVDQEYAQSIDAARQAVKLIASSDLARFLEDEDAVKTAQRVCDDPFREATRVSTMKTIAMAGHLLTLDSFAGQALLVFNWLSHARDSATIADFRTAHGPLLADLSEMLAGLGHTANSKTEE